ncbi:hypothetical protein MHB50_17220 [Siminovitchia sp. FSL H7-0308]|uniref:hypothetical protein n=1 Tax=Siminovitchia sp. FSL H7-0308 TaxID=2921432 RepID=UPI0030ED0A44
MEGTVVIVGNMVAIPLGIDMMFAALLTIVIGQLMELMTANVIAISLLWHYAPTVLQLALLAWFPPKKLQMLIKKQLHLFIGGVV